MKWERRKVSDVCDLAYGKSLTADSRIPGDYPVYGSAGEVGSHINYLVEAPGVVIGRKGSVGTVYYEKRNFFPIDTAYYVIPKGENDIRFLYYKFQTLGLEKLNSDAAVPGLNRNVAYEQVSFYPPLLTQRKIAGILSAYDDLIENNLKRIKLLEEKAMLRYRQIVSEERMKKCILSDFGDVITGKTPSTAVADYFGEDVPFIKTPDMHSQIFVEHTEQMLSELGAKSQEKKFLPPLSLCVSCIGTAGVVGITSKPSQTNQQINSIVFYNIKNVYFFYALMSQMKEQLEALGSNGSTFTNVNKSKFENMEVFVPGKKVLDEFAVEFDRSFNLILTLQKQNAKLREARDILLPRLMSGEIEV